MVSDSISGFFTDAEFIYRSLITGSNDYAFIWDLSKDAVMVSPNMVKDFELPGTYVENFLVRWKPRIHERDIDRVEKTFKELASGTEDKMSLEYQVYSTSGKYLWISTRGTIKRDGDGRAVMVAGTIHNLEYDGKIDNVTGIFSYEKCRDLFDVTSSGHQDYSGSIMLLGIDEFTSINTMNNHSFGDLVLRTTVQDIQKFLMENMTLYRFDGDQFVILGSGLSEEDMGHVYAKIQQYTQDVHSLNGQTYRFTVSAGLICYPEDGISWLDLQKGASIALKYAKDQGKNQCVRFTREMLEEKLYEQSISSLLSDSIGNSFQGFRLVFQPVCEAETLKIKGAEALLRFDTPDGRTISPLEFIPLLENSRLIIPVGIWVLEQAMIACKEWVKELPNFVMNVNVSYIQLRDPQFCEKVENLLELYELDTRNLTLELTESYFITDAPNINSSLTRLQELHLQLAMDDFGTGYSSLARLAQFNVDVIKIDKIFVQSLHKSKYNHDFVDSVVRLCHNVGMKVCVEGVETREEQKSISLLNVDYIQGFYVSKPIDKAVFYKTFIQNPTVNDKLVVIPDREFRHRQLVSDRDLLLAMIDATPLSLNIWNREDELLACNEEILSLFKVNTFEQFRENFFKYSPEVQPDGKRSVERSKELIHKTFETGREKTFWIHMTEQGETFPAEVTLVRIPYQNDFIVASYTRDIREQIAMQEKSKRFSSRLKAILDASPLCLNLWNKAYQNTMCNKAAVEMFGLDSEEDYTEYFFKLSPKYQPDGKLSDIEAIVRLKEAFEKGWVQFNWMHCRLNGDPVPAEITLVRIDGLDDDNQAMVAGFTRDIGIQMAAEQAERAAAMRIKAVIDVTPLTCLLMDEKGRVIDCNQVAVEMFGAKDKEEVISCYTDFLPPYQPDGSPSMERRRQKIMEVQEHGKGIYEWVYLNRQKEEIPCEITIVRLKSPDDNIIVMYGRDLRELRKTLALNARLTQMAYFDLLTGCASRASFLEQLKENLSQLKSAEDFGLIIFDFDYFKNVNDTYGHDAGDMTLRCVVSKLDSMLPEGAVLGRYGGDEFTIQVKGMARSEMERFLDKAVQEVMSLELHHEMATYHTSISMGCTYWKGREDTIEEMTKRADEALYEAKRRGRRCGVIL